MTTRKTIMIIEDEPAICDLLKRVLELEGYDTMVAPNGQAAIELLKTGPKPCLILLDNMMPVMSGTEFIKTISQDHLIATIPVAMVSAYEEPANVGHAKAFIKKPIDFDALLKFVKEWCG
ncbi:MAG: response regulator [Deltaproteobacteria bacterium]|nr:response regulator [Deltaproteobacteria bacterium]